MFKNILIFCLLSTAGFSSNLYQSQIKVIDRCTYLVEPLKIDALGLKGVNADGYESQKAIRACLKSLETHPDDPHVQFLLARAYSKGRSKDQIINMPRRMTLLIPELYDANSNHSKGFLLAKKSCGGGDLVHCKS